MIGPWVTCRLELAHIICPQQKASGLLGMYKLDASNNNAQQQISGVKRLHGSNALWHSAKTTQKML